MEPIKIIVKDSSAVVFNSVDLASGVRGLMCKFSFNAPWKNLIKNVTFRAGTQTKTILNIKDNEVEVPINILEEVGSLLEVGIEGFSTSGRLIITTLYATIGRIKQGAEVDDIEDVPEVWQQIYELAEEAKALALQANGIGSTYELVNAPKGSLFSIKEDELRIMCPYDTEWVFQQPGNGANKNNYYIGLKIFAPNNSIYSFKESLDEEIIDDTMYYFENNDFAGIDENDRKFSLVWLPVAQFNENTQIWNYYGKLSSKEKYIGWYYTVEWYNANGLKVASNSIRINLSNENCHTNNKPYYMGQININQLTQTANDVLILYGGSATENIQLKEE